MCWVVGCLVVCFAIVLGVLFLFVVLFVCWAFAFLVFVALFVRMGPFLFACLPRLCVGLLRNGLLKYSVKCLCECVNALTDSF